MTSEKLDRTTPKRLIILHQFDPTNALPAHVRIHLNHLREHASRLVLVSNSPLLATSMAEAEALCDKVIERPNIGWDFAGWRDALLAEDMSSWDSVVLTNSSIVGPLFPLAPIFRKMEDHGCAFWGLMHSKQIRSHLPSYFLSFSAPVIRSQAWRSYWQNVDDLTDKWDVIRQYETKLTRFFAKHGFDWDSYIPTPRFPASLKIVPVERLGGWIKLPYDINRVGRTVRDHYALIEEGMPYLKASLVWGQDRARCVPIEQIKETAGISYPWKEIGL